MHEEKISERELLRKQLKEYVDKTPLTLIDIAAQIGLCYAHVQRFLKYPDHQIGRVSLIKIKQFLASR